MRQALEVVAVVIAAVVVAGTILSAVRAVILPRAAPVRVPTFAIRSVRATFRLRAKRFATFEERDRIMAMLAPVALLLTLAIWLLTIIGAYWLVFFAVTRDSWSSSLELSGSSVFTLGTTSNGHLGPSLLAYSEAGLGLLFVALFITYFPTIYNAFSRRENGVALLGVRAGNPPQATTMLIRYQAIEDTGYRLTELWQQWEGWFTDIEESHTTFPILVFFRSPQPHRSWITAAGTLLDAAAFWVACVEHPRDADAQLTLRGGFLTLRRIADAFAIPYNPDPNPDDPITIARSEWDGAIDALAASGMAILPDRDQAWRDWKGWRVNYDTVLLRLARMVEAPPAPWVSDRSPLPTTSERGRDDRTASGPTRWSGLWRARQR
jgi:hypothetical protein